MSGRIPIKIFEYNRDGKHIRTFQNMSLCRSFHFSDIDGKMPILRFKRVGIEYGLTKDENYKSFGVLVFLGTFGYIGSMMFGSFFGDTEQMFFYILLGAALSIYIGRLNEHKINQSK